MTLDAVQHRLRQLEESQNLDEATKAKTRELYQQTVQELELAKNWSGTAQGFGQMASTAPEELVRAKADLEALPREVSVVLPEASVLQLEQTLSQKGSELAEKKGVLAELEAEPKRRAARRVDIPKLAVGARERLTDTEKQLQSAATTEASEASMARRLLLLARCQAIQQEIQSYEKELRAYEARAELLPLRRDLAAAQVAMAEQELTQLRAALNRHRQRDAETQLRRAQREAEHAHPAIAELTDRNAALAERRKALAPLIDQTTRQLDDANQELAALQDQFKRIQEKVDTVGLTNAIGLLLRKQREAIPDVRSRRRSIKSRQLTVRESQLELLQTEDRRSELANLDGQIQDKLHLAGQAGQADDHEELELAVRSALETERDYLDALIVDLNSYFDKLVDLDNTERQLAKHSEEYAGYIDERVLWIRSASAFGRPDLRHLVQGAAWLVDPQAWIDLAGGLFGDVKANPIFAAMALLTFCPLLWIQPRLRRRTVQIGEIAERANCCRLVPTVEVILLTVLMASVIPGVLWYVSWRLAGGAESTEFAKAAAVGLEYAAGVYLALELLRQICRSDGLAEAHFGWPAAVLTALRQYIRAAKLLVLPLIFVAVTLGSQDNDRLADSLGRFSFVVAMLFTSLLVRRSLRRNGTIHQTLLATRRRGGFRWIRFVAYPLAVAVPLSLAVLAAVGYYYTAQQLSQRLLASAFILLGLSLLGNLLLRWVLVKRRKLAIEQARQRRAANQVEGGSEGEPGAVLVIPTPSEPNLDLATINVQTRNFIGYSLALTGFLGIWLVWVDVLPALRILDRIPLWKSLEQAEAVSLADAGLAFLIFMTMLIAAKNIPGLLEMALLQRLPLDAGSRYTIGTVSRYGIVLIGLLVACDTIGLSWSKVQWLIAAVSVGLGFGLQEIFANFVSGLIILVERPVRVGDVVTVDDITGVVSKIRMRATTITNWDRKEFIVPNKEFITGRLLNWTLSDQVNRVVVTVGIAYGSDTNLAADLLGKVAQEHPLVLEEPAPRVTFEAFGESSLDYVLRCYLPDMENRLQVIHDLHIAIDREFRQAGIEIAFPQRDIHVRMVQGAPEVFDGRRKTESAPEDGSQEGSQREKESRRVA